MEQAALERIIDRSRCDRVLDLNAIYLKSLPESISNITDLRELYLNLCGLTSLPESTGNLGNLTKLDLRDNQLTSLPESIGNLSNLTELNLRDNQLNSLPKSISNLTNLSFLSLGNNLLVDLSMLKELPKLKRVDFMVVYLSRRYWTKLNDWKAEWLLDEYNAEIRRNLIEQVGYERICDELNSITIDTWREYTLLKINKVGRIYGQGRSIREPMVLLKMTCPSTTPD